MIKKQLKRRKKEGIIGFLILIGIYFFFMGAVLVMGIYGDEIEEVFVIGTISAMVVGLVLQFFVGSFCFFREFNLAISMGQTRKQFVWCYELVSVLEFLAIAVLGRGFWALEEGIYYWVIPEARLLFQADIIFGWKQLLLIILGAVAVQMLFQALLLRYGMKVYWVIWFAWMLVAYTPVIVSKNSVLAQKSMAFLAWSVRIAAEFGGNFWTLVGLGVSGGVIGIAWMFLRKQQVTI